VLVLRFRCFSRRRTAAGRRARWPRWWRSAAPAGTPYTPSNGPKIPRKGRIKQGAFLTTFGDLKMSLEDQCREAVRIGLVGFELSQPRNGRR
jgi:hypothetical protein